MIDKDITTNIIKRATEILFIKNPRGTSIGAFFGALSNGLIKFLKPTLDSFKSFDFSQLNLFYCIVMGIFVFNIGSFFKKDYISPDIEEKLNYIKIACKEGKLTDMQRRWMYISLYRKILESSELNEDTSKKLTAIKNKLEPKI